MAVIPTDILRRELRIQKDNPSVAHFHTRLSEEQTKKRQQSYMVKCYGFPSLDPLNPLLIPTV